MTSALGKFVWGCIYVMYVLIFNKWKRVQREEKVISSETPFTSRLLNLENTYSISRLILYLEYVNHNIHIYTQINYYF